LYNNDDWYIYCSYSHFSILIIIDDCNCNGARSALAYWSIRVKYGKSFFSKIRKSLNLFLHFKRPKCFVEGWAKELVTNTCGRGREMSHALWVSFGAIHPRMDIHPPTPVCLSFRHFNGHPSPPCYSVVLWVYSFVHYVTVQRNCYLQIMSVIYSCCILREMTAHGQLPKATFAQFHGVISSRLFRVGHETSKMA